MKCFNYWLYVEPYVYVSLKKENLLLYNCLNGKSLEYLNNSSITILVKRLIRKDNLYVIGLSDNEVLKPEISNFIKKIRKDFFGDVINSKYSDGKPIQFKPIINIQKNINFLKKSSDLNVGRNMMKNLLEISIYINNECGLNCKNCEGLYKQFKFCTKQNKKELNINQLRKIFKDLQGTSLQKINILGGNICKYSDLNELNLLLDKNFSSVEFYIHYKNINTLKWFNKKFTLNILVTPLIDISKLKEVNKIAIYKNIKKHFTFVIENINDLYSVQKLITEIKITDYTIRPYYNKKNIIFFRKYIFLSKKDIIEAKPNQNDIFIRQNLNQNYFGKIIITSEGSIFSNLNNSCLGNLNKISTRDAIFKEMNNGNSWFKLRSKIKPCKSCIYCFLCPSISNYEYAVGEFNLCNFVNHNKAKSLQ